MVAPMSERFVEAIERFVEREGIDLVTFEKGQRKDDIAKQYLAAFTGEEGVLFIGKAQEKASVFRTEKRRDAAGKTYPWLIRSTAMVNHYYSQFVGSRLLADMLVEDVTCCDEELIRRVGTTERDQPPRHGCGRDGREGRRISKIGQARLSGAPAILERDQARVVRI